MCILEEGDALCPQAPHDISLIPHCHSIHLHHLPQWDPTYTVPLKPTQPHIIPTHSIPQHHPPLHHPPHSTTIIPLPPHHPPTHHQPPARTRCRCTLWDMLSLPGDLSISCSHQKPGGPIEYLGVAGRSEDKEPPTGCVQVSGAEDALSLLEGGTPFTGHQPITQRDLGWPGPRLCEGGGDFRPRPRPNKKTNGIQTPMALSSPGF